MQNKRVLSSLILAAFTASTAGAQCYQFSGPGATLQITISSFVSKNGPTFSNGTGYTTSDYFQGNNSLTIGGVTQTSISTTNTPTCVNCMIGSAIFNYQPGSGSVTAFTMSVPANLPGPMNSWFVVLGGMGDVIPSGVLPQPSAFPPISSWVLPFNEDNIVVNSASGSVDYPITSIGPCSGGAGSPPAAAPTISGVVSASAFGGFANVAPGSWVEIYGTNLAPDTREWAGTDFSGNNAPTTLDGVQVMIGGQNAFIDYISSSPGQVNAQLPSNIATGGMLQLTLSNGGVISNPVNIFVNPTEPGLLAPASFNIGGKQYAVALLSDGATYVLPTGAIAGINSRPAHPGETITLYGVGFGPVSGGFSAGEIVTGDNQLTTSFQMTFGGSMAQLTYDGLAPTFVGLYQFDVVVPAIADSDAVPLTFNLGGTPGTQALYTAVQQ
jgi:uncharacterized protein (TIGR03437 family)